MQETREKRLVRR